MKTTLNDIRNDVASHSYDWLAYFMAHAPAIPPEWFSPEMPPTPVKNPKWRWCTGCMADSDCLGTNDCKKLQEHRMEVAIFNDLKKRETLLQWPLYWAKEQVRRLQEGRTE